MLRLLRLLAGRGRPEPKPDETDTDNPQCKYCGRYQNEGHFSGCPYGD